MASARQDDALRNQNGCSRLRPVVGLVSDRWLVSSPTGGWSRFRSVVGLVSDRGCRLRGGQPPMNGEPAPIRDTTYREQSPRGIRLPRRIRPRHRRRPVPADSRAPHRSSHQPSRPALRVWICHREAYPPDSRASGVKYCRVAHRRYRDRDHDLRGVQGRPRSAWEVDPHTPGHEPGTAIAR
jgi:hypothetical protein